MSFSLQDSLGRQIWDTTKFFGAKQKHNFGPDIESWGVYDPIGSSRCKCQSLANFKSLSRHLGSTGNQKWNAGKQKLSCDRKHCDCEHCWILSSWRIEWKGGRERTIRDDRASRIKETNRRQKESRGALTNECQNPRTARQASWLLLQPGMWKLALEWPGTMGVGTFDGENFSQQGEIKLQTDHSRSKHTQLITMHIPWSGKCFVSVDWLIRFEKRETSKIFEEQIAGEKIAHCVNDGVNKNDMFIVTTKGIFDIYKKTALMGIILHIIWRKSMSINLAQVKRMQINWKQRIMIEIWFADMSVK